MKRSSVNTDRRRRKLITILWVALLSTGTIILLYKEMSAMLYILATAGITALLVVVAMAKLGPADGPSGETSGEPASIKRI